jgi:protein-S-isoprenylcysteine O-methyltransferase Ste14
MGAASVVQSPLRAPQGTGILRIAHRTGAIVQPIIASYVLWIFWVLTWLAAVMGARHEVRKLSPLQNALYRLAVLLGTFALLFGLLFWPGIEVQYTLWHPLRSTGGWLLVLLIFLAFAFAWWARIHHGLHWAGAKRTEKFHLVDNGPYGIMRQPVTAGLIVAAFATAVETGRPSGFCGALLMTIAFVAKALIEDRALRDEMDAYEDYAGRVAMLFPSFRRHKAAPAAPSLLHDTGPRTRNAVRTGLPQGVTDPAAKP